MILESVIGLLTISAVVNVGQWLALRGKQDTINRQATTICSKEKYISEISERHYGIMDEMINTTSDAVAEEAATKEKLVADIADMVLRMPKLNQDVKTRIVSGVQRLYEAS